MILKHILYNILQNDFFSGEFFYINNSNLLKNYKKTFI